LALKRNSNPQRWEKANTLFFGISLDNNFKTSIEFLLRNQALSLRRTELSGKIVQSKRFFFSSF